MSDYVEVENLPKANKLINDDYVLINQNEDDAKVDMGTIKDFVRPSNASTTESGLVSTSEQSFSGKKKFTETSANKSTIDNLISNKATLGDATVNDLHITGNLIQDGETIETEIETLKVKDQVIVTRSGATTGMTDGEVTGIVAEKYDGQNNGVLVFGSDGLARVGDEGDAQPLATREETPNNGSLQVWDEQTQSLKSFPFGQKGQYLRQGENGLEYGSAVAVDGTASEEYVDNKVQEEATIRQNAIEEAKNLANATGVLAVAKGGTGKTTLKDSANALLNGLETGASTPSDGDYYISQYVNGGTTTTTYHRRPVSALWEYIKGKISSVLGLTASNYNGTSKKATNDGSGNNIVNTYATKTALSNQIATIEDVFMPIGFVYTQWPLTKSPSELKFPGTWSDISWKYKGLFPRVDGGDAAPFNKSLSVASQSGTTLTFASGHGIIKGYMLINTANGEQRNVTAVTGSTVTIDSAFSSTLTTVLIGQTEGLPNITGEASFRPISDASSVITSLNTGVFSKSEPYKKLTGGNYYGAGTGSQYNAVGVLGFDASLLNSIYGNSDHVTPCNTSIKVWQRVS